jgi:hypothetical protein
MINPKSPIESTNERIATDRARQEQSLRNQYTGTTHMSRCRAAANDVVEYSRRGSVELAGEARRTLDTLCWSPEGYPESIRAILREGGLS